METYAGPYSAVLAGGGRSILCGKRDACLAGIWLVAAIDGGKSTITTFFDKVGQYTNADDVVAATGMDNMEAVSVKK